MAEPRIYPVSASDLTKLLMILFFAKFLMDRERDINDKKRSYRGSR